MSEIKSLVWTKTAAGYTATGETGRFYSIVRHNGQFRLAGGGGHADQTLGTLKFLKAKCDEIEYAVVTDARTEADEQAREDRAKALKAFGGQYKTPANTTAEEDAVKAERKPSVLSKLVKPVAEPTAPHLIVKARAGTGKTTTLVGALEVLWGRTPRTAKGDPIVPSPQQRAVWDAVALSKGAKKVAFVAFNVSIKDELQRRVPPGCEAMTSHGLGNRALRSAFGNLRLDKGRVDTILEEMLEKDVWTLRRQHGPMVTAVKELVSMCKANLKEGTPDELDELVAHYEIELDGTKAQVYDLVPQVLDRCKEFGRDRAMDFDDMVWGPVALDLPMPKYDLLMVDECLPGWTPVMVGDGSSKEIKDVEVGDVVRSYDTSTGRAKNCKVTAVQRVPNRKPLVKVTVKQNHRTGTNRKRNFVVCTTDHKLWTVNRGWVEAGQIQLDDVVVVETAAPTTQKGKISAAGRDRLSEIHVGNEKGSGHGASAEEFNRIKGGNGRGPTTPQRLLLEALGAGWQAEYVVALGGRYDGYPTNYKIDVANPRHKIAIEIDGNSHRGKELLDAKKDEYLRANGWTVYRVTNRQIARDFAGVLQDVCPDGTSCPMPATVTAVEPTYITEHYVYDITVEDCHNFYANGILVHNCQDLNRAQQALVRKAAKRLVLCGDDRQAIYGFAGADSDSLPRMEAELGATGQGCEVLPLTVTRRCGKRIVAEAAAIVPDFEAHESNGEGLVRRSVWDGESKACYRNEARDGDMLLCRVNAPLVQECFWFLKNGRKASIQGRNVGEGLIRLVRKVTDDDDTTPATRLVELLGRWLDEETRKEQAKKNPDDDRLINLGDRHDCIVVFTEGAGTAGDVVRKIEEVFTDDKAKPGIRLSSIHRAKGLEARRVFLLEPERATVPHPMAKTAWQVGQEFNLRYVAITRAIEELVYVS